jgi:extracellular elastinolytic metalloproteinase
MHISTSSTYVTPFLCCQCSSHNPQDGVPFANAVANVAFDKHDKVLSFASSFVKPTSVPPSKPTVSLQDAISTAENALHAKFNHYPPTLEYLALDDGSVALTHVVQIQDNDIWKEAFIDAHSAQLRAVTDFVAKASVSISSVATRFVLSEPVVPRAPHHQTEPKGWLSASRRSSGYIRISPRMAHHQP